MAEREGQPDGGSQAFESAIRRREGEETRVRVTAGPVDQTDSRRGSLFSFIGGLVGAVGPWPR
jgi:hypothetical protein